MSALFTATESDTEREATPTRHHRAVVIGSGFGGISAALMLKRRGIDDFVILERRPFAGGTWAQNTYPGAQVDVHSPLYSISSEPYRWTKMFAEQAEIERYCAHVRAKHGLDERLVLDANVTSSRWDEAGGRWLIETESAGRFSATFLINATGPLSTPVIPDVPGAETFRGPAFHTNDWDHSVDLTHKRVAVVGSGASAAQVIPAIGPQVGELHVFQRSPHWVLPRPDRSFSELERLALGLPPVYRALRTAIYWNLETRVIGFKYSRAMLEKVAQASALALLERQVPDPELRARLTPDYTIGCKRIILSNALYPALSAANCTLHDRSDAIDHLDATGAVTTQGTHVDLDVIVWSTGYDATDGLISYPVLGRDGVALAERWEEFPRAYLGTTIPGFPNLFIVTGPNTGIGHTSAIFLIEAQMRYIAKAIAAVDRSGSRAIEVRPEAEERYTTMIHTEMERTVWQNGGCQSWYKSRSGHVVAMFPGFSFSFRAMAERFRRDDHAFS